jgi:hypothetical protein
MLPRCNSIASDRRLIVADVSAIEYDDGAVRGIDEEVGVNATDGQGAAWLSQGRLVDETGKRS